MLQEPFVEYFESRARRGFLDWDVAAMLITDYRQRATAVSMLPTRQAPRPLGSVRTKPVKHRGTLALERKTG